MFLANNEFEPSTANPASRIARLGRDRRTLRRGSAALAVLGLAGLGWWVLGGSHQPAAAMPAPEVAVAFPLQRNIVEYDELTGRFEPSRSVEIRPRVSGQLQSINFRDGAYVRAGQLLFTIDPRPFAAALAEAQARAAAARTAASLADAELGRALKLVVDLAVSREEVDNLRAAAQSAHANIAATDAVVAQRRLDLEFTNVRAPISGKISYRRVDPGSQVASGAGSAGTLLTTINAVDPIYFTFDVSEGLLLKAQRERGAASGAAQPIDIRLQDEADYRWHGVVDFTDNGLDAGSGTIRARAVVRNDTGFLTPGMFGSMRLSTGRPVAALLLPDSAVSTDQAGKSVLTIGKKGQPVPVSVTVGPVIDGLRVIKSGLSADAKVVIRGQQRIMPGMPIQAKLTRFVADTTRSASPVATEQPASSAAFAN
jgi:RND family efflux transporter MFP subunit